MSIWRCKIRASVKIFVWKILHNIVPTKSLLAKRGITIVHSCSWCGFVNEDLNHLLWTCPLANTFWSILHNWIDVPRVLMPNNMFDILHLFHFCKDKSTVRYWHSFVSTTLWSIWKTRNECTFCNTRKDSKGMVFLLRYTIYRWMNNRRSIHDHSSALANVWNINPLGFLRIQTLSKKDNLLGFLLSKFDLVGFSDGAWVSGPQRSIQA